MRRYGFGPVLPALVMCIITVGCGENQRDEIILEEYAEERAEPAAFERPPSAPGERPIPETEVIFDEESMELARDTVDAGPHVLLFNNLTEGITTECVVTRDRQGWKTREIRPQAGGATLDIVLEPGTYEIICPFEPEQFGVGTEDGGVRATLTVR